MITIQVRNISIPPQKFPYFPLQSLNSFTPVHRESLIWFLSLKSNLHFLEFYMYREQYSTFPSPFLAWLLSLKMILKFTHVVVCINNLLPFIAEQSFAPIPLYGNAIIYSLLCCWAVSSLELLQINMLQTFVHKSLSEHMISFLSG